MEDAKRKHEQWIRYMQDQGWSHGPELDEAAKKHPLMVPFEQLPSTQIADERIEDGEDAEPVEGPDERIEDGEDAEPVEGPDEDDTESGDGYVGENGAAPAVQEPDANG